jgi:hypothetical protein
VFRAVYIRGELNREKCAAEVGEGPQAQAGQIKVAYDGGDLRIQVLEHHVVPQF